MCASVYNSTNGDSNFAPWNFDERSCCVLRVATSRCRLDVIFYFYIFHIYCFYLIPLRKRCVGQRTMVDWRKEPGLSRCLRLPYLTIARVYLTDAWYCAHQSYRPVPARGLFKYYVMHNCTKIIPGLRSSVRTQDALAACFSVHTMHSYQRQ